MVSDVSYALDVVVPRGTEYIGTVLITFNILKIPTGSPLALDFRGLQIG